MTLWLFLRVELISFHARTCPGKIMADNFLYISIALLVSTFDISKAKNDEGQEIAPECTYSSGVVR